MKALCYLEGAIVVNNSEKPEVRELLEKISKALLDNYDKLTNVNFQRITQALVSSGLTVESASLRTLLVKYMKEHINDATFSADTKLNMVRVFEQAKIEKNVVKDLLHGELSKINTDESIESLHWEQFELFITNLIEIEGKDLSNESQGQILNLLKEVSSPYVSVIAGKILIKYGMNYDLVPKLWDQIGQNMFESKVIDIPTDQFAALASFIALSGYKNQDVWKHIKEKIVLSSKFLDASSYIDMRNAFVKKLPEERAFISYLEMKTIGRFFMFGRSQKSPLIPSKTNQKKKVPVAIEQALEYRTA